MRSQRDAPCLEGPRVLLRPLRSGDFDAWHDVRKRSRDWLEAWEPLPEPGSPDPATDPDAFRARCGAWDRQRQFDAAYGFGVFLRDGERFAGEVSLGNVQRGPFQSAYVGYWIDEALAGPGYVPEACVAVFRFGFETLGLHRLQVAIVPRNLASRRVARKLWLRGEGVALRYLEIDGHWEDHVRYAITAEEWSQRRAELTAAFLT